MRHSSVPLFVAVSVGCVGTVCLVILGYIFCASSEADTEIEAYGLRIKSSNLGIVIMFLAVVLVGLSIRGGVALARRRKTEGTQVRVSGNINAHGKNTGAVTGVEIRGGCHTVEFEPGTSIHASANNAESVTGLRVDAEIPPEEDA